MPVYDEQQSYQDMDDNMYELLAIQKAWIAMKLWRKFFQAHKVLNEKKLADEMSDSSQPGKEAAH